MPLVTGAEAELTVGEGNLRADARVSHTASVQD